ncbi:hypothetical protein HC752_06750 [Vibrio sp. S9_S30]|uniref:galactose-binding domain-containing protein n=1 Tax=Vibrio sp. S9_S30 TaxID=2720226 RepID=UPI001680AA53|nr:discoidin domain-containing protein [Vibrio sp. S9_S30]MBD1556631.1 hypothetical protein [Vibrio sp. S9_S30]
MNCFNKLLTGKYLIFKGLALMCFGMSNLNAAEFGKYGIATQSSTHNSGSASRANDGNTNGSWASGSVSHTAVGDAQPWWQLELPLITNIEEITLWNRTDGNFQYRLSNFYVFISNDDLTNKTLAELLADSSVHNIYFDGTASTKTEISINQVGKYVRVQLTSNSDPLALAEVNVEGTVDSPNVALGKIAQQSSTFNSVYDLSASNAVDNQLDRSGKPSGNAADGAVAHTDAEAAPWWQVDLGNTYKVENVKLWNRTDGHQDRLKDVTVTSHRVNSLDVSNALATSSQTIDGQLSRETTIEVNEPAQFINVQLTSGGQDQFLQLAEVQVYGWEKLNIHPNSVSMSGVFNNRTKAAHAVDGKLNSNGTVASRFDQDTVSHTPLQHQPWLEADLAGTAYIDSIQITPRTDCCMQRLDNVYVLVSSEPFGNRTLNDLLGDDSVWSTQLESVRTTVDFPVEQNGRYVRVQLPEEGYLQLAELEVFGQVLSDLKFADTLEYRSIAVQQDGYHVWGSSPIWGDDGKVHIFAARYATTRPFDPGWKEISEVAHYTSTSPEGPFNFESVVFSGTGVSGDWNMRSGHNPHITKIDGKYVLTFISNNSGIGGYAQFTGMMLSDSLYGPWEWVNNGQPIVLPPNDPENWTYRSRNIVNAAVIKVDNPDDTTPYHIYFKSGYTAPDGKSFTVYGLAQSSSLEGPYVIDKTPVANAGRAIEDGYVFQYKGKVFLITTDNYGAIEYGGGLLWQSDDGGESFYLKEQAFRPAARHIPASISEQHTPIQHYGSSWKFERPQLLIEDSGKPSYLFAPSGRSFQGSDGTTSYSLRINQTLLDLWFGQLE